jgi:hypothetical protein
MAFSFCLHLFLLLPPPPPPQPPLLLSSCLPQLHPNLVGAALIFQDDQHDFKIIELARWALPNIPNAQYVIQPYETNPPHRFNISQGRVTHRLRWSGSSDASQLTFDSFAADTGALLQSWTGTGELRCVECCRIMWWHTPGVLVTV